MLWGVARTRSVYYTKVTASWAPASKAKVPEFVRPCLPGPPKEPKIMARYPKMESIGSTGSIILAILEVQVNNRLLFWGTVAYYGLLGFPAGLGVLTLGARVIRRLYNVSSSKFPSMSSPNLAMKSCLVLKIVSTWTF